MRSSNGQLRGMRVLALLIDLGLAAGLALVVGWLLSLVVGRVPGTAGTLLVRSTWGLAWAGVIGFLLVRDGVGKGSPGRRLLGLRVVCLGRRRRPGVLRSVARNLPLLIPGWNLWELHLLGSGEGRRIGDRWAHTRIEEI